ncbi:MAG: tyrosine-type recombinase/integrase [Candidatus Aenigmarchaeota archaeon]|nr:tyrosine-type recombinase/integrase [Candidatus Aenigmarchaeota archaeon]
MRKPRIYKRKLPPSKKYPNGHESKEWWYYFCYKGFEVRCKGTTNYELTKDIAKDHLARVMEERDLLQGPCTLEYLLDVIFLEKHSKENKRSYPRDITSVKALKKEFPPDMLITDIDFAMVDNYKNKRKKEITNSSVNRELAALRKAFNLAIKRRFAVRNPVSEVEFLPENKRRTRYLTKDEIAELLHHSPSHLRPMVTFALNTGMRSAEIFGLTWENIDTEQWIAEIPETKNGDSRQVPLNSEAISAMGEPKEEGYIFTHNGNGIKRVTKSFNRACEKAAIKDFRFHDLRHTWASYFMMGNGNLYDLMATGGWKSIDMVRRYAHLSRDYQRRVMEAGSPTAGLVQNHGQNPNSEPTEFTSA